MQSAKLSDNLYYEYALSPQQLKYLIKIWSFKCKSLTSNGISYSLLPDYTATLLFIQFKDSTSKRRLAFLGPSPEKSTLTTSGEVFLIGFRYHPAILPQLLGLDPVKIKNKLVYSDEIEVFDNYRTLLNKLNSTINPRSILKQMNDLAEDLSKQIRYPDHDTAKAIDLMINSGGNIRESLVVDKLSIGKRQFQRKFLESTGLSPKEFCRLLRLHQSTRELATGKNDQYDVLVNAGYYDQSHYYREFKKLMGILPTAFVSRQKSIRYGRLVK